PHNGTPFVAVALGVLPHPVMPHRAMNYLSLDPVRQALRHRDGGHFRWQLTVCSLLRGGSRFGSRRIGHRSWLRIIQRSLDFHESLAGRELFSLKRSVVERVSRCSEQGITRPRWTGRSGGNLTFLEIGASALLVAGRSARCGPDWIRLEGIG